MIQLLRILSLWEGKCGGLTLEVYARSPGDTYHLFELGNEKDHPFRFEDDLDRTPGLVDYIKQYYFPDFMCRKQHPVDGIVQRIYGTPLQFRPWSMRNAMPILPKTPIVQGLLLRAIFSRGISYGSLAKLFRESLIALKWVRLEKWTILPPKLTIDSYQGITPYYSE